MPDEPLGPELEVPKKNITRYCLRCQMRFTIQSKFLRLCDNCRRTATNLHTPFVEGW